jgi:hypothetical protein
MTATGLDFGGASANRRVYVIFAGGFGALDIVNGSSFIGGSTNPDFSGQAIASGGGVSMWWATALQPSGTTGQTVTLEFNGTIFSFGVFAVYVVDDTTLLSKVPVIGTNTASAATSLSASVATLANGSIISAIYTAGGTSDETISSSTTGLSVDAANQGGSAGFGHANNTGAIGASSVAWQWSGSMDAGVCNFAFR